MLDAHQTNLAFKNYLRQYDQTDGKIQLKIVHTYGVLKASCFLADQLGLSPEDIELAKIIAILHDIGRFEQLKRYNSFDDQNVDHAILAVDILKKNNLIREFIPSSQYDKIIYQVILNHSNFSIAHDLNAHALLHTKIIRDADKLDNFRVKNEEEIQTLFGINQQELEKQTISPTIYKEFSEHRLIKKQDRITHLDIWLSYLAFLFDLNFQGSYLYLKHYNYLEYLFHRIQPKDLKTRKEMMKLKQSALRYLADKFG